MRKSLIATGILAVTGTVLALTAPRAVSNVVRDRLVDEAAARGVDVHIDSLRLGLSGVTLAEACVDAPEHPSNATLLCVSDIDISMPLIRAVRGDVEVSSVSVGGAYLDASSTVGTLEEVEGYLNALVAAVEGPPATPEAPETPDPPRDRPTREAPELPAIQVEQIEFRLAGQDLPLERLQLSNLVVAQGTDNGLTVAATGRAVSLQVAQIPFLSEAPEGFGFTLVRDPFGSWSGTFEPDQVVTFGTPPSMGGIRVSFEAIGAQAPSTVHVDGLTVSMAGQETPLLVTDRFELELRDIPTGIEDLYMARAALENPTVHLALNADGVPVVAANGQPTAEPDAEPDTEPGTAPTAPDGDANAASDPWADRIWWERVPQRIDVNNGTLSIERPVDGTPRTLHVEGVALNYALRAIRTQADVAWTGSVRTDDGEGAPFAVDAEYNWATSALRLDLSVEGADLSGLEVAVPALEPLGLAGVLSLETHFRERDNGEIPRFEGSLAITDLAGQPTILREPLSIDRFAWEWSASLSREGDDARALVFERGDGELNGARFTFTPILRRFRYDQPYPFERLEVRFGVPDQDAMSLLRAVPSSLLGDVAGAVMSGTWGMDIAFPVDWVEPEDGGRRGIDIDQPSHFEVRDANLHLTSLPESVDVRRLNSATSFVFRGPNDAIQRAMTVPAPRGEGEAGSPEGWARLQDISYFLIAATLYREDGRFFTNRGINWFQWRAVLEEAWTTGSLGRGASTISMQLVKNVFLSHERSLERKLQELFLTYWMTRLVPKERILEVYLNVIEWGPGVNGVVEASTHYFGTAPSELSLAESVWLSSIVPAPVRRGAQRAAGAPADWSVRHSRDIMTGMESRGWITATELGKGMNADVRFVTSAPRDRGLAGRDLDSDPLGPSEPLFPVPAPEMAAETGRLALPPAARIGALISGQLALRP